MANVTILHFTFYYITFYYISLTLTAIHIINFYAIHFPLTLPLYRTLTSVNMLIWLLQRSDKHTCLCECSCTTDVLNMLSGNSGATLSSSQVHNVRVFARWGERPKFTVLSAAASWPPFNNTSNQSPNQPINAFTDCNIDFHEKRLLCCRGVL